MSEQRITPEVAEHNRERTGGYTFNLFPEDDYEGRVFVFAAIRIGDHAHVEASTGWALAARHGQDSSVRHSFAGRLVMAWRDWLVFRDKLAEGEDVRIAEIERPTIGQAERYVAAPSNAEAFPDAMAKR
jgi:hypothetical protein